MLFVLKEIRAFTKEAMQKCSPVKTENMEGRKVRMLNTKSVRF